MCETLLPDVVASEVHQNDCSYVCELSGPTLDSLRKNFAWWAVTQRTSKLGGRRLCGDGCFAWDNTVVLNYGSSKLSSIVYVPTLKLFT